MDSSLARSLIASSFMLEVGFNHVLVKHSASLTARSFRARRWARESWASTVSGLHHSVEVLELVVTDPFSIHGQQRPVTGPLP